MTYSFVRPRTPHCAWHVTTIKRHLSSSLWLDQTAINWRINNDGNTDTTATTVLCSLEVDADHPSVVQRKFQQMSL